MKTFSSFILLTVVSMLSNFAWGQVATVDPESERKKAAIAEETLKYQKEKDTKSECRSLIDRASEAVRKAKLACNGENKEACKSKAEECANIDEEEREPSTLNSLASSFGSQFGVEIPPGDKTDGNYHGLCMNREDFKSEVSQNERKEDRLREQVSRLNKDLARTQKDANEAQSKAQKELAEIPKKLQKEEAEAAAAQRKRAEEAQANNATASSQMQNMRLEVIQQQGALANLIAQRSASLLELTDAVLSTTCLEKIEAIEKSQEGFKKGSVGTVAKNSFVRMARNKQTLSICLKRAQALRAGQVENSDRQIQAAEAAIEAKQKDIKNLEESLKLRSQNLSAEDAQTLQTKQQNSQSAMQEMQTLTSSAQNQQKITTEEITNLQKELNEAKRNLNKASNRLQVLGTKSAGEQVPSKALAEYETAANLISTCNSNACTGCPGLDGATSVSPAPAPVTSPSVPPTTPPTKPNR